MDSPSFERFNWSNPKLAFLFVTFLSQSGITIEGLRSPTGITIEGLRFQDGVTIEGLRSPTGVTIGGLRFT